MALRGSQDILLVAADLGSPESLDAMCRQATVVISAAGPFTLFGSPVVEACVRSGTHYCDISGAPPSPGEARPTGPATCAEQAAACRPPAGEIPWVRRMIEAWHDAAAARGVRLVHCCGYDSVPYDLAAWLALTRLRSQHNACAGRCPPAHPPLPAGA